MIHKAPHSRVLFLGGIQNEYMKHINRSAVFAYKIHIQFLRLSLTHAHTHAHAHAHTHTRTHTHTHVVESVHCYA